MTEAKICKVCNKNKTSKHILCNTCRYKLKNEKGLCGRCDNLLVPGGSSKTLCEKHLLQLREAKKLRPSGTVCTKKIVVEHYGAKCACCGESNYKFLTIDHINNDGAAHRKSIGTATNSLYNWIIKNNFPDTIQILCWNCNCGRHHNNGICPHKD